MQVCGHLTGQTQRNLKIDPGLNEWLVSEIARAYSEERRKVHDRNITLVGRFFRIFRPSVSTWPFVGA